MWNNVRYAEDCECKQAKVAAGTPERYEHSTLESFEFGLRSGGEDAILLQAQYMSRNFVESYPVETGGCGLFFTEVSGLGKIHLAIGVLRSLILERVARGVFCDY